MAHYMVTYGFYDHIAAMSTKQRAWEVATQSAKNDGRAIEIRRNPGFKLLARIWRDMEGLQYIEY